MKRFSMGTLSLILLIGTPLVYFNWRQVGALLTRWATFFQIEMSWSYWSGVHCFYWCSGGPMSQPLVWLGALLIGLVVAFTNVLSHRAADRCVAVVVLALAAWFFQFI